MAKTKKELLELQAIESEKITGTFSYHECPGGVLKFSYAKFPKEPIKDYTLIDGETYELPLYVARHLNNSGIYKGYKEIDTPMGKKRVEVKNKRYSFSSTGFIYAPRVEDKIVTVKD